jgi:hypothetical protein
MMRLEVKGGMGGGERVIADLNIDLEVRGALTPKTPALTYGRELRGKSSVLGAEPFDLTSQLA